MPTYQFHIRRAQREKYQVDDTLFSLRGTIVFANFYAARLLAQKINVARGGDGFVQAGELNALGLIHEILHFVLQQYRQQRGDVMAQAVATLYEQVGADAVEATLQRFVDEFPPLPVYRGQQTITEYLNGTSDNVPNREIAVEEMMLVWLENQNPAASPFKELFDDAPLFQTTAYPRVMSTLREFFAAQERLGATGQTLLEALRAPFFSAPGSLSEQLDFMLYRWSAVAGRFDLSRFFARAIGGIQFIQEEQRYLWQQTQAFGGGGFTATTPPVPVFRREFQKRVDEKGQEVWFEPEPEQFSVDLDWMPNLVLLAKSTYVWLEQLSKKYGRAITTLDAIPDEELNELRARGITGLWFIGVWERSKASATIKHLMGNTGALASAYSLYDYQIAQELGGQAALEELKARAWKRGIRIASDMVPNHMGVDSRWVIEHPDWFVQNGVPPYPSYTFNSPDLSSDSRVTIQIEDHYFEKTDAAVVFKRYDHRTGETRFIYHGNDGTSFPWNDTAQLNYLVPQVREAVIQTILHVARQTPVIRFDAAMTLAKKHFQRLWYPTPGESNTIPSRGEHAMTKTDFDAAMPEEFWREVVDRVAAEAPDTLLLAEAFWLMEGYFVRTLGMHRVYNSAFMHMLRDEKNLEYRLVIKNTIEFDPEVLKRYVNFMNNPDERTAVDQFGKGDKYFGVATLMSTLPGLPMFGHGQIEGYTERYGMEFKTAMLDESPDHWLVERHQREIFPLLHKRYLFAGVENFLLYDVYKPDGTVQENVFAYSNRVGSNNVGNESSLVVYNNSYTEARGRIRVSAAFRDKTRDELVQRILATGLNLRDEDNSFVIFRDMMGANEFLRPARDLIYNGFDISLGAYKYAVYLDFRQVTDTPDGSYAKLNERLHGRGVPNVEQAMRDIQLAPLYAAFREMVNGESLKAYAEPDSRQEQDAKDHETRAQAMAFAEVVKEFGVANVDAGVFAARVAKNLTGVRKINEYVAPNHASKVLQQAADDLAIRLANGSTRAGLAAFAYLDALGALTKRAADGARVVAWIDEWQLGRMLGDALRAIAVPDVRIWQLIQLAKIALQHPDGISLEQLLRDADVAQFLNVNEFEGVMWFNQEQFAALTDWLQVSSAWRAVRDTSAGSKRNAVLTQQYAEWSARRAAEAQSEYQVAKLLAALPKRKTSPAKTSQLQVALAKSKTTTKRAAAKTGAKGTGTPGTRAKPVGNHKAAASKTKPTALKIKLTTGNKKTVKSKTGASRTAKKKSSRK